MVEAQILTLGNCVGGLLESLPLQERGMAIQEIQKLEDYFEEGLKSHRGKNPKLSVQLLRIEQIKMVPRLREEPSSKWSNVPKNYGQAVMNFLENLPLPYRLQALKKIKDIASKFALETFNSKKRSECR